MIKKRQSIVSKFDTCIERKREIEIERVIRILSLSKYDLWNQICETHFHDILCLQGGVAQVVSFVQWRPISSCFFQHLNSTMAGIPVLDVLTSRISL